VRQVPSSSRPGDKAADGSRIKVDEENVGVVYVETDLQFSELGPALVDPLTPCWL
jgi:hypothetical protein